MSTGYVLLFGVEKVENMGIPLSLLRRWLWLLFIVVGSAGDGSRSGLEARSI